MAIVHHNLVSTNNDHEKWFNQFPEELEESFLFIFQDPEETSRNSAGISGNGEMREFECKCPKPCLRPGKHFVAGPIGSIGNPNTRMLVEMKGNER